MIQFKKLCGHAAVLMHVPHVGVWRCTHCFGSGLLAIVYVHRLQPYSISHLGFVEAQIAPTMLLCPSPNSWCREGWSPRDDGHAIAAYDSEANILFEIQEPEAVCICLDIAFNIIKNKTNRTIKISNSRILFHLWNSSS